MPPFIPPSLTNTMAPSGFERAPSSKCERSYLSISCFNNDHDACSVKNCQCECHDKPTQPVPASAEPEHGWWLGEECEVSQLCRGSIFVLDGRWYCKTENMSFDSYLKCCGVNQNNGGFECVHQSTRVRPVHFGKASRTWRYGPELDSLPNDKPIAMTRYVYVNGKLREIILEGQ